MKTLQLFIASILLSLYTFTTTAQSSIEYKVRFDKAESLSSESFEMEAETDEPMASITAYILQDATDAELYYRLETFDGWEEWTPMQRFTEGETPGRTTFNGGITEQSFSAIQFKSTTTLPGEVTFRVYYPGSAKKKSPAVNVKDGAGANCSCPKPPICYRNCWCPSGNCPKDTSPSYTVADHLIVHHSAGSNTSSNYAAVVRSIWDFHVNTNGWSDIGYNFLIDGNGVIYEARGDSVLGAHFSCMNHETVGICLLGNFELTAPNDSAISSLIKMLTWEACDKNIAPTLSSYHNSSQLTIPNISGHSHANTSTAPHGCPKGTLCPGDSLFRLLPMIRDSVATYSCLGDVSLRRVEGANDIKVYPNPVVNKMTITGMPAGQGTVQIINYTGQILWSSKIIVNGNEEWSFSTSFLSPGLYLLVLENDGRRTTKSFIKQL